MTNQNQVQQQNEKLTKFDVNGQEVTLSNSIVRKMITTDPNVTNVEISTFIAMAKSMELNPFVNDIYLIKYGTNPAQFVISKDAFLKKANRNSDYDGFKAGLIVQRNNEIVYTEGAFTLDTDRILGAWAEVYRKSINQPTKVEISRKEFGKNQSTWKSMPGNMLRKTALVNALREAFPDNFGGVYTKEETENFNEASGRTTATNVEENQAEKPKHQTLDDIIGAGDTKEEVEHKEEPLQEEGTQEKSERPRKTIEAVTHDHDETNLFENAGGKA
ncbi:phage recombination protein Bet [Holzapfeliella sp. He02]|uniref:Phage recombination protein Bet n=1 Tax=Holzapfeliella saturejae TaxID=3082953 RepID=A0ABU8SHX1_9LACO